MEDRTYTFIDLSPELVKVWKQDTCNHIHQTFSHSRTHDNKEFWADLECFDCGKKMGERFYWSEVENNNNQTKF